MCPGCYNVISETNSWMLNLTRFLVWTGLPGWLFHVSWGVLTSGYLCDQENGPQLLFQTVRPPWVHSAICFTRQVSVSGTMVFGIRLGWWGAHWIPTRVLSLDGWNWCSEEVEDPKKVHFLFVVWDSTSGVTWLWGRLAQRLWAMCLLGSTHGGWVFCVFPGYVEVQGCPSEEGDTSPFGIAWQPSAC